MLGSIDGFVPKIITRASRHSDTTRIAFKTLKARMTSAPMLLIPKSGQEAEFVAATDASKVDIAVIIL